MTFKKKIGNQWEIVRHSSLPLNFTWHLWPDRNHQLSDPLEKNHRVETSMVKAG